MKLFFMSKKPHLIPLKKFFNKAMHFKISNQVKINIPKSISIGLLIVKNLDAT